MKTFLKPKKLFTLLAAALLACGCASLKKGDIPPESQWEKTQPLTLEMTADIFQVRLDLFREKEVNPFSTGASASTQAGSSSVTTVPGTYKSKSDLVPHHYLGTYIGSGLFIDINGNIGVDIIRLFGLDTAKAFKLHRTQKGNIDAPAEVSRESDTITINDGEWKSDDVVTKIENEGLSIRTSRFFSPDKIVFGKNKIEFIPSGLLSGLRTSYVQQDGDFTRGSTTYRVEMTDENKINLNGAYEIIREENKIIIKSRNNSSPLYTIVKTGNRYVFFRSESYGSWIQMTDDAKITISNSGSITEYACEIRGLQLKRADKAEEPAPQKRTSKAKKGRVKTEKKVDKNTNRDESSPLPPN